MVYICNYFLNGRSHWRRTLRMVIKKDLRKMLFSLDFFSCRRCELRKKYHRCKCEVVGAATVAATGSFVTAPRLLAEMDTMAHIHHVDILTISHFMCHTLFRYSAIDGNLHISPDHRSPSNSLTTVSVCRAG